MGKESAIEWCDASWNPWMGCHKVSQGCKNCYMFREQTQYGRDPNVVVRSKTTFNAPLSWQEPAKVFTCSWSDWFIEEADEWRAEAWEIIRKTPHLTYQILTKRPENIRDRLPADWGNGYSNVWLGVSAEDQGNANNRIPILLKIPAAIRFVSAEPVLGPIDLGLPFISDNPWMVQRHIDWVIIGGESGPGCRPMNIKWARDIVSQCQQTWVPVFVKQLGGWPDKRHDISKFPPDLQIREFPVEAQS